MHYLNHYANADIMIIGNTVVGEVLKDGYILKEGNSISDELFSMNEIIHLKNQYNIKKVVITHLEDYCYLHSY